MFHVKIKLKNSSIHGIGLFADEDIKKNTLIYSPDKDLDTFLTEEEFENLSLAEKKNMEHFGFLDKKENKWHLSHDDIRFCNHCFNASMTSQGEKIIAKKDILKGEELTQNYEEFENLREELKE